MAFKISGFGSYEVDKIEARPIQQGEQQIIVPRKSIVQVRFPGKGMALSYYNDQFDLKLGDLVYVDGKLEGQLGRVVEINYNFKIKLSDYKRVIGVANTDVIGEFRLAGSHFITVDGGALTYEQAATWIFIFIMVLLLGFALFSAIRRRIL